VVTRTTVYLQGKTVIRLGSGMLICVMLQRHTAIHLACSELKHTAVQNTAKSTDVLPQLLISMQRCFLRLIASVPSSWPTPSSFSLGARFVTP